MCWQVIPARTWSLWAGETFVTTRSGLERSRPMFPILLARVPTIWDLPLPNVSFWHKFGWRSGTCVMLWMSTYGKAFRPRGCCPKPISDILNTPKFCWGPSVLSILSPVFSISNVFMGNERSCCLLPKAEAAVMVKPPCFFCSPPAHATGTGLS